MDDLISRQAAIDALKGLPTWWADEGGFYGGAQPPMTALLDPEDAVSAIANLPSAQPEPSTEIQEILNYLDTTLHPIVSPYNWYVYSELHDMVSMLPSAQPEPISEAYSKAVWTWLINYQIKVAELKGRYTPYEVLSWVANDWRKEHERSYKQAGTKASYVP